MKFLPTLVFAAAAPSASSARADEAQFLKSLDGNWSGTGMVKVLIYSPAINVTCKIKSKATPSALTLNGKCTGLVVFSRVIGADLKVHGAKYTGSYVGSQSGTAALSGSRSGNAINLAIRWATEVNGDRAAKMTLEKVGNNGMRLTTVDNDPATGKSVVVSRIDLHRS
ncbi:hypothetical protein BPNPMPFG_002429 [Mesorhizobium sp. AR07]|nr:hypothetical protein [Mesorhizobium sp. AR07]UVK46725.1 hypothetical protein BPNPMPFG_002429 [Mesorhizobium sp. AR07]